MGVAPIIISMEAMVEFNFFTMLCQMLFSFCVKMSDTCDDYWPSNGDFPKLLCIGPEQYQIQYFQGKIC